MQVGIYISDLLYRHDCVVIPEFGAILSRRVAAQYIEDNHAIYPPRKGLSFNAQITQNDGLLVNYMASVEQIPYENALQEVRNYVRFLNHEIDNKGSITIHKVGRFNRNSEQALQFTPMHLVNYLSESFGLAAQEIYGVDRSFTVQQEAVLPQELTVETLLEKPVVQLETPATKSPNWVRYAAAAALLIGASYGAFNGYVNHLNKTDLLVQQMADKQVKARVQEASFNIANPLPSLNLQVTAIQDAITTNVASQDVKPQFHVIAGAFRNPENADLKVAELRGLGFNAHRIGVNKYNLHNVAFNSFTNAKDATKELLKLKAAGYVNAWLLTGAL